MVNKKLKKQLGLYDIFAISTGAMFSTCLFYCRAWQLHGLDMRLPGECLIVIVYRHGDLIIPHSNTELEPGDKLSVIGNPKDIHWLMNFDEEEAS
jgi:hypothetical protein